MSLPKYIVNLEEVLEFLVPNTRDDMNTNLEKGCQRSKGLRLLTGKKGGNEISWRPSTVMHITGIKIGVGSDKDHHSDSFDMYIGKDLVFKNLSMKGISHYKNFRVYRTVKENEEIRFVYNNKSRTEKEVWFDIDYHADPLLCPVVVRCLDDSSLEIQVKIYDMSIGRHLFGAPQIDGYILTDEKYYKEVSITKADAKTPREVIFNYEKR